MRSSSHLTLIAIVREAVEMWRKRERLSVSSVVQCIVETHERTGSDVTSEIVFEQGGDAHRRQQTNGERVYRWLDDVTKTNNHLPSNFLPSILAALPLDLRIDCVGRLLTPLGLSVRVAATTSDGETIGRTLQAVAKESGEATAAIAALVDSRSPQDMHAAKKELAESIAAQTGALSLVESMMTK